jgi:trimeric autotransporter adhesin
MSRARTLASAIGANDLLTVARGGTGQTSYTNGQLLIGNASGGLTKATISAGNGITVTDGDGSISIAASGGGTPDFVLSSYGLV